MDGLRQCCRAKVVPYLVLGALAILTLGAAILGARSHSETWPPVSGTSCNLLTPEDAATLLGGPVQGPPANPFSSQECAFTRDNARLSVAADTNPYIESQV
jgi:hypothetical protein